MTIPLFKRLEIETNSSCNRYCNFCLRNSTPDRDSVKSWFEKNQLPIDVFERVLDESISMGFKGEVCLSHYNEPLMDERLPELGRMVKKKGFRHLFIGTNADFLTKELAADLDGTFDVLGIALYHMTPEKFKTRSDWLMTLFKKTKITIGNVDQDNKQMITHYSSIVPDANLLAKRYSNNPCFHPLKRMIVNHRGDMLLCCDDLTGHFDLGNVFDSSVDELWHSDRHQQFVNELQKAGGRTHPHCLTCPRS